MRIEYPKCSIQYPKCSIEYPKFSIEYSTISIGCTTFGIEYLKYCMVIIIVFSCFKNRSCFVYNCG